MPNDLIETQHEAFKLPTNKDIPIWRYMDLAKYLAMLNNRGLFFSRATLLGDPFEGSTPAAVVKAREYIRANRATDPNLVNWKDVPDSLFEDIERFTKEMVKSYHVSCWHMNEHESDAMWKLYSSSDDSVCIRSTYRQLRLCLPSCVMVGEVNYIDYGRADFSELERTGFSERNAIHKIMHKRLSFAHERELRAIFWEMDGKPEAATYKSRISPAGLTIEVELPSLIEQVYISPTAAPWFAKLVQDITGKFGFSFTVSQSGLASAPLY